MALNFTN
ncbi:hypothetical protein S7711_11554 [Stachybotrys chartarum IBT 7711]|nr:hypothetical protein S7711_11594 [Stachybotrys chartarum IBT 7711]KEY73248.1 hypothetical protein S7711_11554 [Stachybotrys chartarum IBT 7711]